MRKTITQTAVEVALAMEGRSEDPWTKVGAVALTSDNRIIATAYNGLLPGINMPDVWDHLRPGVDAVKFLFHAQEKEIEDYRNLRLPFMVHAEQNLCSLIKRGEATWVVTTVCPCPSCLLLLACHGVKKIVYIRDYARDNRTMEIARFYSIEMCHEKE